MPAIHTVISFEKPADTTEFNEAIQNVTVLKGAAIDGERVGREYLDQFGVGEEVTISLISPTGKAARVHAYALAHILESAGVAVKANSVIDEGYDAGSISDAGPIGKSMMSRVQAWGRVNRVGSQVPMIHDLAEQRDASELRTGGRTLFTTVSSMQARSEETRAWANSKEGVFIDEVTTADPSSQPVPRKP